MYYTKALLYVYQYRRLKRKLKKCSFSPWHNANVINTLLVNKIKFKSNILLKLFCNTKRCYFTVRVQLIKYDK